MSSSKPTYLPQSLSLNATIVLSWNVNMVQLMLHHNKKVSLMCKMKGHTAQLTRLYCVCSSNLHTAFSLVWNFWTTSISLSSNGRQLDLKTNWISYHITILHYLTITLYFMIISKKLKISCIHICVQHLFNQNICWSNYYRWSIWEGNISD